MSNQRLTFNTAQELYNYLGAMTQDLNTVYLQQEEGAGDWVLSEEARLLTDGSVVTDLINHVAFI